jgi:hypothetical protein
MAIIRDTNATFIINPIPSSIIKIDAINGPLARPILEINPAKATICPCVSNVEHSPRIYGIEKPQAIPVTVLAIKYIKTLSE